MNRPQLITEHLSNRFENRDARGESCEGCYSTYTRESPISGLYRCPRCEAYMAAFDVMLQSYGVMLEEWRHKFGLSREGALQHAREFDGLFDYIQNLLMDGYGMRDLEELLDREEESAAGTEAAD